MRLSTKPTPWAGLATAMWLALPASAWAGSLVGQPVLGELGNNTTSDDAFDDDDFTVFLQDTGEIGPDVEIVLVDPSMTGDFSDSGDTLVVHMDGGFGDAAFNGLRFELTDPLAPDFTSVVLSSSTFPGIDDSSVTFEGRRVAVNFSGLSGTGDVTIDLQADVPQLDLDGTCPGPVTITMTNYTPSGTIAILRGTGPGSDVFPRGPCVGLPSGLAGLALQTTLPADVAGERIATPDLSAGACGVWLQGLDVTTCDLSGVVEIPPL